MQRTAEMTEGEDPGLLSPMETGFKDLYDSYNYFAANEAPGTNSHLPPLIELWDSEWTSASLAATSFGGAVMSLGSNIGPNVARAGLESLSQVFVEDYHPQARKQVSLATLYDNRQIKKNVEIFKCLYRHSPAERLVRLKFRNDIADGADGIWLVFDCVCHETDQRLAVDFLTGNFVRLSKRAATVLELLGANPAFQNLYCKHMKLPIAVVLANNSDLPSLLDPIVYTAANLPDWNFKKATIDTNPLMRVIKKDLSTFIRLRDSAFIERTRSSINGICVDYKTIGSTLLPSNGCHGPKTRTDRANDIHQKIYPRNKFQSSIPLDVSANDKNLVQLYCSPSTRAAANDLVDTVGSINLALGSYRKMQGIKGSLYIIPWETMPLAAMVVEVEIRTQRNCGVHGTAARQGMFNSLRMFSRIERGIFEGHVKTWKRLRAPGSPYRKQLDQLLEDLNNGQDLARIAPGFLARAMPLSVGHASGRG
ncbi:hypothetical protein HYPSUDRAFT_58656 [Hypholoma sublateritium FD-334 SS-4]|uniref:Uncharacterized protein n=1 Tax=Hypholoma sublateritium (strain FD-334 SS-4) TaxID=945553 RepID=A0A0D2P5L5_HYPSF|nr:hypothetical protein HYPSUDRAFT_58656 [Hypholoma sublateritium FD-334 SS-4]